MCSQRPDASAPTIAAVTPPTDVRINRIKLPKLQLRSFNGDLTKWTAFWESFESAVHNNSELSEVEKFNYLNSLLERSAREAVSGLALTAANRPLEPSKGDLNANNLLSTSTWMPYCKLKLSPPPRTAEH